MHTYVLRTLLSREFLPILHITVVVQCMGMAVVVVMVKPLLATKRYSSTMITAIYYSIGAIFTALAATPAVITNPGLLSLGGEAMAWIALVYATYFATVINYNIFTWATITTSTATVSLYATLQPLFTGVISILLGARITALTGESS